MSTETTVEVVENDSGNDEANTSEIISAVDAHVAANDAEDAQDNAEQAAENAADSAADSEVAAVVAVESAIATEQIAGTMSAELAEMRAIASEQAETSRNLLKIFEGMQGQKLNELPEPAIEEPEEQPDSGNWYSRKLW